MKIPPMLILQERDHGYTRAVIFILENQVPPEVIKQLHREILCLISEQDRVDCEWSKVRHDAWKFTVLIQPYDFAARFRKDVYLWKVLNRIDPKNTPDFASFMLH